MSAIFLVFLLALILAMAAAICALPRWRWINHEVAVSRSVLVGVTVFLLSKSFPFLPSTIHGLLTVIGIGLILRPTVRAMFRIES